MMKYRTTVFLIWCMIGWTASQTDGVASEVYDLVRAGQRLSVDQKESLEQQVAQHPDDTEARTKLLGYYFVKRIGDFDSRSAQLSHIVWLIKNAPRSEVLGLPYGQVNRILDPGGYGQCKEAWLETIKLLPRDLDVLSNAAGFFQLWDRELAEEFLLKGQRLDPKNPSWPESLGRLTQRAIQKQTDQEARSELADQAFAYFEQAFELSPPVRQESMMPHLAKSAFEAGQIDEARQYAEKMLDNDEAGWNRGNRIHHGHLILGRIALGEEDLKEAKARLLKAGKTPGSPQLNSFGPNMQLAHELLSRGEQQVVLEYFELCREFWKLDRQRLTRWAQEVKAGRVPNFGANRSY